MPSCSQNNEQMLSLKQQSSGALPPRTRSSEPHHCGFVADQAKQRWNCRRKSILQRAHRMLARNAAESSAANAAAPPGSATMRNTSHSAACASRMASSGTRTTLCTLRLSDGKHQLADAARCERVRSDASSRSVHRTAGFERIRKRGAASGSTPTMRVRPAYHAAMPPMSPPPPTATSRVSSCGDCSSSSSPKLPWPIASPIDRRRARAARPIGLPTLRWQQRRRHSARLYTSSAQ